jgi:hypothetical protein
MFQVYWLQYSRILVGMVSVDLAGFAYTIKEKFIDTAARLGSRGLVYGIFLPIIGAPQSYIGIYFAGAVFAAGMFEYTGTVASFVSEMELEDGMSFELVMPFTQRLVYTKALFAHIFRAMTSSILALMFAKIILWNGFDLSNISLIKFGISLFSVHLLTGSFSLWSATFVYDVSDITLIRRALLYPFYFLGGHMFPWHIAYQAIPKYCSYALLVNPFMFATESVRAALLGQKMFINFWAGLLSIYGFSLILLFLGWKRFVKRIDLLRGEYGGRG